jgi:hypothetical protein
MLDFVPHYAEKLPIIAQFWRRERDRYEEREGKTIDFSTAYWSPPLTPHGVYDLERSQINDFGLEAVVSLTDHDSIDGNLSVNESTENSRAPISLEWTVPFDYGFFHVGVHNLPKDRAVELTKTLLDYTFNKENHSDANLQEVFAGTSRSLTKEFYSHARPVDPRIRDQRFPVVVGEQSCHRNGRGPWHPDRHGRRPPRVPAEYGDQPDQRGNVRRVRERDPRR